MFPMFVDPMAPGLAAALVVDTWPVLGALAAVATAAAVVVVGLVGRDRAERSDRPATPPLRKAA